MKKKILIVILIVLIILLIFICAIKIPKKPSKSENTSRNFILSESTNSTINTHGENSGIYVGVTDNGKENYLFISIKINKDTSEEEQIKSLISSISNSIGYKIDINSISKENNSIKIDLSKTSAPFELTNSYNQTDSIQYFITNENVVPKTIFDSITKTLKSYFGQDIKVYFSADSENISIENEITTLNINKDEEYKID